MPNFPGSLDTFTTKVPHVSSNAAADVNALQDAVVAIETTLKTTPNPNPLDYVSKTQPDTISGVKLFATWPWFTGAKGDGVTDDAPAIQAAVTAAGNVHGVVEFPPGTYGIKSTITVKTLGPSLA